MRSEPGAKRARESGRGKADEGKRRKAIEGQADKGGDKAVWPLYIIHEGDGTEGVHPRREQETARRRTRKEPPNRRGLFGRRGGGGGVIDVTSKTVPDGARKEPPNLRDRLGRRAQEPEQQVHARIDLAVSERWEAVAGGTRRVYAVQPTPHFLGTHADCKTSDVSPPADLSSFLQRQHSGMACRTPATSAWTAASAGAKAASCCCGQAPSGRIWATRRLRTGTGRLQQTRMRRRLCGTASVAQPLVNANETRPLKHGPTGPGQRASEAARFKNADDV